MERELRVRREILPLFDLGKDCEVRLGGGYINRIEVNDILFLGGKVCRKVKEIRHFQNFHDMLAVIPPHRIFPRPGVTKETVLALLRSVYTDNDVRSRRVRVFVLTKIST
jgi:ASC-1-like (ASCH) protein